MTQPGPQQVLCNGVLLFDIETNGLLHQMDRIHVLVLRDPSKERSLVFSGGPNADGPVEEGVRILLRQTESGGIIIGHNVIKFDVPAIHKIYPWFKPNPKCVWDTLVLTRLIYPDLIDLDTRLMARKVNPLPRHLFKRHSLEAWGQRLGDFKDDYSGDPAIADEAERKRRKWESWNQSMEDYCVQDVHVTMLLWLKLLSNVEGTAEFAARQEGFKPTKKAPVLAGFYIESLVLENAVAHILARQERWGFAFNVEAAQRLHAKLVKAKLDIEEELKRVFKPRWFKDGPVQTPKVSRRDQEEALGLNLKRPIYEGKGKARTVKGYYYKSYDYTEGAPYQKIKLVEFNPGSRAHITIWLKSLYGWEPDEFTADGSAKVDETVLSQLPYPEAAVFKKYLVIEKRLGQIAEGKEAWLRHETNGRIHGQVITNGAVTGRMTHSKPNSAQVPSSKSPYGHECRECWTVPLGKVLVGADAQALELRDLAGYMARFDGGAYIITVTQGKNEDGTDMHTVNTRALGLEPKKEYFDGEKGRDLAKTWFYAFIYGAGDEKLGFIILKVKGERAKVAGAESRARFLKGLPALGKLVERVKAAVRERGFLRGLDGRILTVRSQHAALNTLLQSAGAVQMKRALVILDEDLQAQGLRNSLYALSPSEVDYEFVANVHDEWQIEANESIGEVVGKTAKAAIRKAGESFDFRCPLDGEFKLGRNWAETH